MRLLITGGDGQVGQALTALAKQQGFDVLAYSKNSLDVSSETMVAATLHRHQPNIVINAAAYTNVEQAEVFPEQASQINAHAVGILGRACDSLNIPLLHISTDYVFSGEKKAPYVETDETMPLSSYGNTKLAGETRLTTSARKYIILRTSWVFSATGNNFVKTMWRLFHEREEVKVVNDQWGSPTSADAIARTLLTIATRVLEPDFHGWGIYHYSGAPAVSWYDFACAIQHACPQGNLKLRCLTPIATHEFPTKAIRPAYAILAMQKIQDVFGVEPCDWQKDLKEVIQQLCCT